MIHHHRFTPRTTTASFCFITALFMVVGAARAQDAPGGNAAPAGDAAVDNAAKPQAADAPKPGNSTVGGETKPAFVKPDPAVDTIVESNPTTPAQLLRAAARLADLGRADLAKKYLKQLAAAKPNETALANAAAQVDPTLLLRMAANDDVRPEGQQWADAALSAAAHLARDPQRLLAMIDKLNDPSPIVRRDALMAILSARADALPALVLALGDEKRVDLQPQIVQTIAQLGEDAVPALGEVLGKRKPATQVPIIEALEKIGAREAIVFLAAPATDEKSPPEVRRAARNALHEIAGIDNPSVADAVKLLTTEIERNLNHERQLVANPEGAVEVWLADADGIPFHRALSREFAYANAAQRLGIDLLRLTPNEQRSQLLMLTATLEVVAYSTGLDDAARLEQAEQSLQFKATDQELLEQVLVYAMKTGHLAAATVAADVLGKIGDTSLLTAHSAEVRPLVQALTKGDRRLALAAAKSIVALKPASGFAGSSDLLNTLAVLANSPGVKRALVVHPNTVATGQMATLLGGLGYETDQASQSRDALSKAIASGDYELVLLSSRLNTPPVWVALQQFRHDPRTAWLPIALLAEDDSDDLNRMRALAENEGQRFVEQTPATAGIKPATTAFLRPVDPAGMKFFVERFNQQTAASIVPAELRKQQALQALIWLGQLNAASPRDFDLRFIEPQITRAFVNSITSAAAAPLLAKIGNHSAQKALANLAGNSTQPLENRQAAAAAFSQAVREHGIQLTTLEIRNQYDRYNRSEIEDAATQQLLGLMLDAIEAHSKQLKR